MIYEYNPGLWLMLAIQSLTLTAAWGNEMKQHGQLDKAHIHNNIIPVRKASQSDLIGVGAIETTERSCNTRCRGLLKTV